MSHNCTDCSELQTETWLCFSFPGTFASLPPSFPVPASPENICLLKDFHLILGPEHVNMNDWKNKVSGGQGETPWPRQFMKEGIELGLQFQRVGVCLSEGFCCCDEKQWPKSKLGEKQFIWLTLLYLCSSSKEIGTETQTGQQPGERSWCRGCGEVPLTGCSTCSLSEPGPPAQGSTKQWAGPSPLITN